MNGLPREFQIGSSTQRRFREFIVCVKPTCGANERIGLNVTIQV
jgi:hypothetical protein